MDMEMQTELVQVVENDDKENSERLGALTALIMEYSTGDDDAGTSVRHLLSLTCSAVVLQAQVLEEIRDAVKALAR